MLGLFVDADRAWNAFHFNWLFFAGVSSAGCTFVAVQRITTARWSREVIRLMEGYVAFLPIAFVFLLLIVFAGKNHIFPWTHEAYPVPEKATYFNPVFFTVRVIAAFVVLQLALAIRRWRLENQRQAPPLATSGKIDARITHIRCIDNQPLYDDKPTPIESSNVVRPCRCLPRDDPCGHRRSARPRRRRPGGPRPA